jgi:Bacterial Ig-like domain
VPRRAALILLLATAVAALLTGCGSPPQVLEISPARGAVDVRSSEVIRVRFDRPMDRRSVADHFAVMPRVQGALTWTSDHELAFEHLPLAPSAQYQVILEPGYRDAQGSANSFRHSWTFRTEAAPTLADSSPGAGDRSVDPAAYISLTFSRAMDAGTLAGAIGLAPSAPFAIHQDAADPRHVVLAPQSLLQPRTGYQVTIGQDARDVDGNRLGAAAALSFSTGDVRPLRHWISFVAESSAGTGGAGLWAVDDNRVPRQLINSPVSEFAWSADGSRLLLRGTDGTWSDQPLDGGAVKLPISGEWADFLAAGRGYAFLDRGTLQVLQPDGTRLTVATGVTSAAVAPGGERIAFVTHDPAGAERATEIDAYDTDLHTRYRLQSEPEAIDGLSWSSDSQSLAYRLGAADATRRQIVVRSLHDGTTTTVATGDVSTPVWEADRQHVAFTAAVPAAGGVVSKAFRFAVADGGRHVLSAAAGMPSGQGVEVDQLSPSPDGHQLAFVSTAGGRQGVWAMNVDGTGLTQLTDPDPNRFSYSCRNVVWTPG